MAYCCFHRINNASGWFHSKNSLLISDNPQFGWMRYVRCHLKKVLKFVIQSIGWYREFIALPIQV